MQGCDAVLHAASVYSLDVRDAESAWRINVAGTETVLNIACARGLDPVVHVSSYVALFPPEGRILTVDAEVKRPRGAYFGSKAQAERVARRLQELGAPVTIAYPGAVFGPHDPNFGESARLLATILARRLPVIPRGGLCIVDVRDLAAAFTAMFERGRGPRRYLLTGTDVSFPGLFDALCEVTGRWIPYVALPPWSLAPAVRLAGLLQRIVPLRLPVSQQGFDAIAWNPRADDGDSAPDLGFSPRALRETLVDMCRWAWRAGYITQTQVGRLATV